MSGKALIDQALSVRQRLNSETYNTMTCRERLFRVAARATGLLHHESDAQIAVRRFQGSACITLIEISLGHQNANRSGTQFCIPRLHV